MKIKPIREKWKGTMTDRERFLNQLNYKPIDRCFNMEFGYWDENFEQWKMFRDNNIKDNYQANELLNFDKKVTIFENIWLSPPFKEKVVEETETSKIFINIDGLLAEVPKDGHSTIPHFIKSSITTPDDWKRLKEEKLRLDDPGRLVNIEELKKAHPPDRDYVLSIHVGSMIGKIRDLLTIEGLAYACYDYPNMVEEMVETCCVLVENLLDQVLPEVDFDIASGWEDISCNSGPLVSMDFFENVITPRYKRIGDKLKKHGIDIYYIDSDGDIRHFIPCFLEAGVNTMFPWEVNGSGHPTEIYEKYGKELRVMGGIDKMKLGLGKEAIKTYLKSVEKLVERGGYIPFCDHRCPPNVKEEDYLYYLDLKEEMFGM
jgi:hypothetical protein